MKITTPASPASRAKIVLVLSVFTFICAGAVLEAIVGSRFIFFYSVRYKEVAWWTFLLLLPVFGATVFKPRIVKESLKHKFPTWWVRWLLMYPITLAIGSAMVVIAPLGWVAFHAWAAGVNTKPVPGRLVSVGDYRRSLKGCDQKGTLAVGEHVGSICLEQIATIPMKPNPSVTVSARQTSLGILVLGVESN